MCGKEVGLIIRTPYYKGCFVQSSTQKDFLTCFTIFFSKTSPLLCSLLTVSTSEVSSILKLKIAPTPTSDCTEISPP